MPTWPHTQRQDLTPIESIQYICSWPCYTVANKEAFRRSCKCRIQMSGCIVDSGPGVQVLETMSFTVEKLGSMRFAQDGSTAVSGDMAK